MDLSAIKRTNQAKKAEDGPLAQVTMATGPSPNPPMPAASGPLTTATATTTTSTTPAQTPWLTYALAAGAIWYFFLRKSR